MALRLYAEGGCEDITAAEVAAATGTDRVALRRCFVDQLGD